MRKQILVYGECNKNDSAVTHLCKQTFYQKIFRFFTFHLTKRMEFMSKFTNLHYVLCFLNQKTKIHVNFANVLWVAFSSPSGSLSLVKYPAYLCCAIILKLKINIKERKSVKNLFGDSVAFLRW
jgi:hypothetical protein